MNAAVRNAVGVLIALALAATANAATPDARLAIPFHGTVAKLSESTLTVGKRDFVADDKTKITKDGQPATLAQAKPGDKVGGSFRQVDGKLVLRTLRIGPAPAKAPKAVKAPKAAKAPAPAMEE